MNRPMTFLACSMFRFLDVIVLDNTHAALVAGGDFLDSILKALQGTDLAFFNIGNS